jgi:hypothetical protein
MEFDTCFRESVSDEDLLHLVAMVSLENDGIILGRSPTSAICLQLSRKIWKVHALSVYAFNYSGGFAPFAHLHAHFYRLLLHADGAADAQVFGKAAGRADVGHSRSPVLPCKRPRYFYRRLAYLSVPSKRGSDT